MSKDTIEEMQEKLSLAGGFMEQSISRFVDAGREVGLRLVSEVEENDEMRAILSAIIDSYDKAIHWEDLRGDMHRAREFLYSK